MGMFLLPGEVHHKMDTLRSKFFWRGDIERFKYHMMRWDNVCLPKDYGGLGILNSKILNESLLLKWIWRIYNADEKDLCCNLLREKYLRTRPLAKCSRTGGSQFWRGIQKVKDRFYMGASFSVGNGENTRFWIDTWLGEVPLKVKFSKLFGCCRSKESLVSDCWKQFEWVVSFRRTFGMAETQEWNHLLQELEGIQPTNNPDRVIWKLEKKGHYTTKSMYRFITFGGVIDRRFRKIWKNRMPLKLRVFVWQALHNRLQTGVVLKKMKWKGDDKCPLCNKPETVDHIFFPVCDCFFCLGVL